MMIRFRAAVALVPLVETSVSGLLPARIVSSRQYSSHPDESPGATGAGPSKATYTAPGGSARLPTSIKKLNRLLAVTPKYEVNEAELEERFVRGSGPGGQAINKTSSSVSLIHVPTGIRVQAQPTRSREQNRKAARRIMGEKLDLHRANGGWDEQRNTWRELVGSSFRPDAQDAEQADGVDEEVVRDAKTQPGEVPVKTAFSREEIKWEKERRRKLNRAKKTKRKQRDAAVEPKDEGAARE